MLYLPAVGQVSGEVTTKYRHQCGPADRMWPACGAVHPAWRPAASAAPSQPRDRQPR